VIVDFHVHTRGSHDCGMDPRRLVRAAGRAGLDAIAVCDHGTIDVALAMRAACGFPVIVGEEVRTTRGEVIGYFLTQAVPPGLTPEETVERIKAQGGLVCVPHPFDRYRTSPLGRDALERIADRIDAVEGLNARNLAGADDAAAREWAAARGIPVVAGSDAHTYYEVGTARTELPAFTDAAGLRQALGAARLLGGHSSPAVHLVTAVRKRLPGRAMGRTAEGGGRSS
jgi:predicted metal-dependent phosphoesterase TrpH